MNEINHRGTPVLIALGSEFLLLTMEEFQEGLQRARALVLQTPVPAGREADEILDAEGIAERTQIPASWFLEQARQNKLPHLRVGKYVRFEVAKVLEALRIGLDTRTDGPHVGRKNARVQQVDVHTDRRSVALKIAAEGQQVKPPCYRRATKNAPAKCP